MNDEVNIFPEPKATPRGGEGHGWGGVDTLGLASGDWVVDDGGTGLSQNAEPARTQTGEPIPAQIAITDTRKSGSITYRANKVGAVTPFALSLGKEYNGYVVTGATLNGSQGWTTIVVQYHSHTDTQVGHMSNEKEITWPSGVLGYGAFGVLGSNFDTAEIQSCNFAATIDHTDRNTNVGQHLVGRSHGVTYTASETAVTDKGEDDVTVGTGWTYTNISPRRPSGNFHEITASAMKFEAASGVV